MIALKQILIPTDFSDASTIAVRYGKAFAESFDARLHLLHVQEEPVVTAIAEGFYLPSGAFAEMKNAALAKLDEIVTQAEMGALKPHVILRKGSPFVEIIRCARELNIDLIVMGTHGRGPIAHMLMGSVAERVVRKAPCPVLTVRNPEHEFVMP